MALVEMKDYNGDLIAKTVQETLDMIGITNKLNINGYHISIFGKYGDMPKGMLEDTPSSHVILIERNKYIDKTDYKTFKRISSNVDDIVDILNEQEEFNIDFIDDNNKEVSHEISHDSNGYLWYKHKVKFDCNKTVLETYESYVKRMFESIADYVIASFESMEEY